MNKAFRTTVILLLCLAISGYTRKSIAQTYTAGESAQTKISRALSAAPPNVAEAATVAEPDGKGGLKILRQGANDFTCMPGDPSAIGKPPMCADKVAMQWYSDFENHSQRDHSLNPFQLRLDRRAAQTRVVRPQKNLRLPGFGAKKAPSESRPQSPPNHNFILPSMETP